jgi:hypothetical protein
MKHTWLGHDPIQQDGIVLHDMGSKALHMMDTQRPQGSISPLEYLDHSKEHSHTLVHLLPILPTRYKHKQTED